MNMEEKIKILIEKYTFLSEIHKRQSVTDLFFKDSYAFLSEQENLFIDDLKKLLDFYLNEKYKNN